MECIICYQKLKDTHACIGCFQVMCGNCSQKSHEQTGKCPKCRQETTCGQKWYAKIPTESEIQKGLDLIKFTDQSFISAKKAVQLAQLYTDFQKKYDAMIELNKRIDSHSTLAIKIPSIDITSKLHQTKEAFIQQRMEALKEEERINELREEAVKAGEDMANKKIKEYKSQFEETRRELESAIRKHNQDRIDLEKDKLKNDTAHGCEAKIRKEIRKELEKNMQTILDYEKTKIIEAANKEAAEILEIANQKRNHALILEQRYIGMINEAEWTQKQIVEAANKEAADILVNAKQKHEKDLVELKKLRAKYINAVAMEKEANRIKKEYEDLKLCLEADIQKKKKIFQEAREIHETIKEIKERKAEAEELCATLSKNLSKFNDEKSHMIQNIRERMDINSKINFLGIEGLLEYMKKIKDMITQAEHVMKGHSATPGYSLAKTLISTMKMHVDQELKNSRLVKKQHRSKRR